MAMPRRAVEVSQSEVQSSVQEHAQRVATLTVPGDTPVDKAITTRLEEVSVLCLQLDSGEKLSAFLAAVSRCKALWDEYVEDEQYRQQMLRAEALLDEVSSAER